jgi:transcriptional regulator with XRE-family HTH domain
MKTITQVGQVFRQMREDEGLEIKAVAMKARLPIATVVAIECGSSRPTVDDLQRLAKALETTLHTVVRLARDPGRLQTEQPLPVAAIARAIIRLPDSVGSKTEAVLLATVRQALEITGDNQSAAARLLGMERKAFVRRMARARRAAA